MKRFVPALLFVLVIAAAACTDSNPVASSDSPQMELSESRSLQEPGFLAAGGLPALATGALAANGNRRNGTSVVCHFSPQEGARPQKMEVPARAAEAHLAVHPEDGYVGHGFSNKAKSVRYDEDCEVLPDPPACPCWNDFPTWSMLASAPWDEPRLLRRNVVGVWSAEGSARAWPLNLRGGRCAYSVTGGARNISEIGPVTQQCAADVMTKFKEIHR